MHEFSKKDQIKNLFEENEKLDMLLCVENNITDYKEAKIKGLSN